MEFLAFLVASILNCLICWFLEIIIEVAFDFLRIIDFYSSKIINLK